MSDARTANLLGALALELTDEMREAIEAESGLAASAPAALAQIAVSPGISIEALSRILGLSHSANVRLIERLAREDLVVKEKSDDGRTVALRLTGAGRKRRDALLAARLERLGAALEALTPDERDRLARLLEKMLAALTRGRGHADHLCRLCDEAVCRGAVCPVEQAALREA